MKVLSAQGTLFGIYNPEAKNKKERKVGFEKKKTLSFLYLIDDFVFLRLQRFKQVGKVQQNAVKLLHSTFVLVCAAFF